MVSIESRFKSQLAQFWKDDFAPLRAAGQTVDAVLREEESAPDADLYRRIATVSAGSHLYFSEGQSVRWKHVRSVAPPDYLLQELEGVQRQLLMGILAEAGLAWITVDDKLYLWHFRDGDQGMVLRFQVPDGQCIVSVGLAPPREGVFKESVRWCLVVTTPEEVLLCVLQAEADESWILIPTGFSIPTDGIRIVSLAADHTGRIFLGGDDGCLYEMHYEGLVSSRRLADLEMGFGLDVDDFLEKFYDNGKALPPILTIDTNYIVTDSDSGIVANLGKRALSNLRTDGLQPRKCRKLNHTRDTFLKAILPDFLSIMGSASSRGAIIKIVTDQERETLYTLSSKGWISTFDLRNNGVRMCAAIDTSKTARMYLEAVSRGQTLPPNTHGSVTLGTVIFPGGSTAAQLGVGGMDGARSILRELDGAGRDKDDSLLRPSSIHLIAPNESTRLTLVAVTGGGLRLYLSALAQSVIVHGHGSGQGWNGRSSIKSSLAPSSRITLCHIRAPPPLTPSTHFESVVVEGGQTACLQRPSRRVTASLYKHGFFIVAMKSDKRSDGDGDGDVIVSTCPDSMARKAVVQPSQDVKQKEELIAPGGVSEIVSLPMSTAYGGKDTSAVVPGGIVWEMAMLPTEETAAERLLMYSQMPSDTELGIGIPPAYHSARRSSSKMLPNSKPTEHHETDSPNLMVVRDNKLMPMKVLVSLIPSILLAIPIRHGIISPERDLTRLNPSLKKAQHCYRISRRDASSGFGLSKSDRRGVDRHGKLRGTVGTSNSARLRQWLLKPCAVPLSTFATQHLANPMEMLALNAGGVHQFRLTSIIACLADAILLAGENVSSDPTITGFFTSYGYREGCVMCFSLAVGCGPGAGNSQSSFQLRRKAIDAALARAFTPRLVVQKTAGDSGRIVGSVVPVVDPLVPSGFDFRPSALSEALTTIVSRLIRGIWHKPLVVVTEGPLIRQRWSSATQVTPARVEILLSDESIEQINRPLRNLMEIMRIKLSRAIKNVPGTSQHNDTKMDIENDADESQYLTRSLQYHSNLRSSQSGESAQLSALAAESIARLIEEKNIHSLYRLLSRVVQLLNLVTLLRRAHAAEELHEIEWGLLHGLTISQITQTSEGQDRIEGLLNGLFIASTDPSGMIELSVEVDQLTEQFSSECYLFFSVASKYFYLGLRAASRAFDCHPTMAQRLGWTRDAAQHFCRAAKHWHSATLITGKQPAKKGREDFTQIAQRALQYGSPLAYAVGVLIRLNDGESAVHICLDVAANFKPSRNLSDSLDSRRQNVTLGLPWEHELYHKRRDVTSNGHVQDFTHMPAQVHSPQVAAYGADISPQDAVDTCYSLIFYHLSILLKSKLIEEQGMASRMVAECAGADDSSFLSAFYTFLLESENADTLLLIRGPGLEKWLQDRQDSDLLWRYYTIQGRHVDAAQVLWGKGSDSALVLSLSARIECLSKALNSFRSALAEYQQTPHLSFGDGQLSQRLLEVEDSLQVARIQNCILHHIESRDDWLDHGITPENYDDLRNKLVPVSDLYNTYAAVLGLYEISLQIFVVCRHQESNAIRLLWKHVMRRVLLPCNTRLEVSYLFLRKFAVEIGCESEVGHPSQPASELPCFENGDWILPLEQKIIGLGRDLFGKGADYVVPLDFLLVLLEELRRLVPDKVAPEWPLVVLSRVGVPHLLILDEYEAVMFRDSRGMLSGGDNSSRLDHSKAMIGLLHNWISSIATNNVARNEVARAVTAGRLLPRIDSIRARLQTMTNTSSLLDRLAALEAAVHAVV